jgi:Zn-dependent peptidase ImmA (M78 family)
MSVILPFKYYNSVDIEYAAEDLISQTKKSNPLFLKENRIDPSQVADFLDLKVAYDKIPPDGKGEIAARILPLDKTIEMNEDFPNQSEGFSNSTLAHEVGHWILHINKDEANGLISQMSIFQDVAVPFLCRSIKEVESKIQPSLPRSQDDNREWQAQFFAACLLMPKFLLIEVLRGRDVTQLKHLYAASDELQVTISHLIYRLKKLEIIETTNEKWRKPKIYKGGKYHAFMES